MTPIERDKISGEKSWHEINEEKNKRNLGRAMNLIFLRLASHAGQKKQKNETKLKPKQVFHKTLSALYRNVFRLPFFFKRR